MSERFQRFSSKFVKKIEQELGEQEAHKLLIKIIKYYEAKRVSKLNQHHYKAYLKKIPNLDKFAETYIVRYKIKHNLPIGTTK